MKAIHLIATGLLASTAFLTNVALSCSAPYIASFMDECYKISTKNGPDWQRTYNYTVGIQKGDVGSGYPVSGTGYKAYIVGIQDSIPVTAQTSIKGSTFYLDEFRVGHSTYYDSGEFTVSSLQPSPLKNVNQIVSSGSTWTYNRINTNAYATYVLKRLAYESESGSIRDEYDLAWKYPANRVIASLQIFDSTNTLVKAAYCKLRSEFKAGQNLKIFYTWNTRTAPFTASCYIEPM